MDTTLQTTTSRPIPRAEPSAWGELSFYILAAASWVALFMLEREGELNLGSQVALVTMGVVAPVAGMLMDSRRRAVAMREFASYFLTPVGYVVLAVFAALAGLFFFLFTGLFEPGSAIETQRIFGPMALWVLIPVTPAISMRLFAEEHRSGNLEALTTAPITDSQLVLGKWLGALGFLAVALSLLLVFVALLEVFGGPDYGPVFTGYVGMVLLGGLFLAVGTLASTFTHNQIIAFLGTLIFISTFTFINSIVTNYYVSGVLSQAMRHINPNEHNHKFSLGMLDSGDFVFFLSTIAFFLVLAVQSLESRKWR